MGPKKQEVNKAAYPTLGGLKSGRGDINKHIIAAEVGDEATEVYRRCHGSPEAWPSRKSGLSHRDWRSECSLT